MVIIETMALASTPAQMGKWYGCAAPIVTDKVMDSCMYEGSLFLNKARFNREE
jgi:hypothetical protein